MSGELSRYDAARRALADARAVDEVKDIRDKAVAMQVYARQAKDQELIEHATEIRLRAERRLGEMLEAGKEDRQSHGGQGGRVSEKPSLKDILGDDHKNLANRARKAAALTEEQFEHKVSEAKRAASSAIDRAASTEDKRETRAAREAELAAAQAADNLTLPQKRYGVILADPEWRFETYSRETGMDRAADNHYPTATTDVIASRPVAEIAADDCVLFLWATVPMLPDALQVLAAWGFTYKSHAIWFKDRIGTGYWFRNDHELLLVGTRGHVPAPAMGTQWKSVQPGAVREHSEKPDWQYELIERYFPTLSKIELNARRARPGWDNWGLDAPSLPQQEAAE